jgi:hypothetical protein
MIKLSNRDSARNLLDDLSLEAQLLAIKSLIDRNGQADQALLQSIKQLSDEAKVAKEEYSAHLVGLWTEEMYQSVFQDAAHSMSAVGMLAPFMESLFVAIFRGLRGRYPKMDQSLTQGERTRRMQTGFWDPHFVVEEDGSTRRDIVAGIGQISEAIGLTASMPGHYLTTLRALFAYRNKMFHNGLEWPLDERQKFSKLLLEKKWPSEWFLQSTSNDAPWIFYMSQVFIDHCLETIDEVLEGVGAFIDKQPPAEVTYAVSV